MPEHLLLQIAIILAAAKIGGEICERWLKQPAVLGEIVLGVLVGNSCLHLVNGNNAFLVQLAEIGAVLLLFEVGLDSDLDELFKVGGAALWVACAGVALPFVFGYLVAHAMGMPTMEAIFVGAAMTATSVGITARVFSDLGVLNTKEAKIVLGAAVADDVIGLIILAVVSALAVTHEVSALGIVELSTLAVLFLGGAIVLGGKLTPVLMRLADRMQARAALAVAAVIVCLVLASLAETVQLAPIVGAFAAGLILAKTDEKVHFEGNVKALADIFVPVFFVMMGARMNLATLSVATPAGRAALIFGGVLLATAIVGKILGGLTVPDRGVHRWAVGIGMIPRGEVGLIFAQIGLARAVIDDKLYASIIFVVICTTFITPPVLKWVMGGASGNRGVPEAADEAAALSTRPPGTECPAPAD